MKLEKQLFSKYKTVWVLSLLIVVACLFAIYLRLFTQQELWYEMFAAVIGVIITAIITMVLLNGQSDNDAKREQNAKVFEEKLRIYQEFLQTLNNVIEDGALTKEEKIKLEFQTSYVAMHCKPCYIKAVSEAVQKIILCQCPKEEQKLNSSNEKEPLLENLFKIVGAFRMDLYADKMNKLDPDRDTYLNDTLEIFSYTYRNAKDVEDGDVQSNEVGFSTRESLPDSQLWDEAVEAWKKEHWIVEDSKGKDQLVIRRDDGMPAHVGIWFGGKDGEHYYIGAGFEGQYDDADFAQPLKNERGGRRSRGWWSKVFPTDFDNM